MQQMRKTGHVTNHSKKLRMYDEGHTFDCYVYEIVAAVYDGHDDDDHVMLWNILRRRRM